MLVDRDKICVHCLREPRKAMQVFENYNYLLENLNLNGIDSLINRAILQSQDMKQTTELNLAKIKLQEAQMLIEKVKKQESV